MIKLGNYLIQHWGTGQFRISKGNKYLVVDDINAVFDSYFSFHLSKDAEDFIVFFDRLSRLSPQELSQDVEYTALKVNGNFDEPKPPLSSQDTLVHYIKQWLDAYNSMYGSYIQLSEILNTITDNFTLK